MRADKKRMLRIIAMLETKTNVRFLEDEDTFVNDKLIEFSKNEPELFKDAIEGVELTNDIDLLTRALIRQKLVDDLNVFKTMKFKGLDEDERTKLQGQFVRIMPALSALNFDVKNKASFEDIQLRNESIKLLVEVFPNIVDDPQNINFEDKTIAELKNRLFNELKNNYFPNLGDKFCKGKFNNVQSFNELVEVIDSRTAYRIKQNLLVSITKGGPMFDKIQEELKSPEVLRYMERESSVEKKELLEDSMYLDFTNDILKYTQNKVANRERKKENQDNAVDIDGKKEENEIIFKLATIIQLYDTEMKDRSSGRYGGIRYRKEIKRNAQLINEAKRNLADILPNVFDEDGKIIKYELERYLRHTIDQEGNEKLAQEYKEYKEKIKKENPEENIDDLESNSVMVFLAKKTKMEKKETVENNVASLYTKQKMISEMESSLENLNKINAIDSTLRVLQVVHYIGRQRQDEKARHYGKKYGYKGKFRLDKNTGTLKGAIEDVETLYKGKLLELYDNDEEKLNEALSKIEKNDYDDTIFPGLISEAKRKVVNKRLARIAKKYDGNDKELDDATKEIVLSTYLSTLDDKPENFIKEVRDSLIVNNGRLLKYLSRINSEIVKDGEVNLDTLLEEYKKVTKKPNIDDIEDAKYTADGEIVEELLTNISKNQSMAITFNGEALRTRLKIDNVKNRRENFEMVQNIGELLQYSMLTRYDFYDENKEDVDLIKGLYLIVQLYGDENLDRIGLSERNNKIQDVEKGLLSIAKDNLTMYFHDILDEDKEIDKDKLEKAFIEYLEKNDPSFIEKLNGGITCADLIKGEIQERKSLIIGPQPIDVIDKQIEQTRLTIEKYKEDKKDSKCIAMIEIVKKMSERLYGSGSGRSIAVKFDEKRKGISTKYNSSKHLVEIDDSYVDAALIIGAKKQLEEFNNKFSSNEGVTIDEMSPREKLDAVYVALSAINSSERVQNYREVTGGYDVKNVAIDVLKKIIPDVITSSREVDKEKVVDEISNLCNAAKLPRRFTWERVAKQADRYVYKSIIYEFKNYDLEIDRESSDELPYFEMLENSKLRLMLKSEKEEQISNQEMNPVFEEKAETLTVDEEQAKDVNGDGSKTVVVNEEVEIEDNEVAKLLQDKEEELHHDNGINIENENGVQTQDKANTQEQTQIRTEEKVVEETSTSKVEQQSDGLNKDTRGITVENIKVAPVEPEKSMVTIESRGLISDVITKIKNIPNLIKNGINNIKDRLGIGQSSSSNNTETGSTSTSSTGGVTKTEQDVVQNLTGYGQQNLDLNAAKAATQNEIGKKVSEKGNELEGNEENERD